MVADGSTNKTMRPMWSQRKSFLMFARSFGYFKNKQKTKQNGCGAATPLLMSAFQRFGRCGCLSPLQPAASQQRPGDTQREKAFGGSATGDKDVFIAQPEDDRDAGGW